MVRLFTPFIRNIGLFINSSASFISVIGGLYLSPKPVSKEKTVRVGLLMFPRRCVSQLNPACRLKVCLYPILNHPGWLDERHCYNGIFDYADDSGSREIYQPLAHELNHQQAAFASSFDKFAAPKALA